MADLTVVEAVANMSSVLIGVGARLVPEVRLQSAQSAKSHQGEMKELTAF